MTTPIQNLRSNVDSKRPTASGLAFGQIAINYNENDPAIYLRGDSDALLKIAPVYIASGAPNATPASGGTSGNSIGEQWLDISTSPATLKLWDGSNWLSPGATSIASGVIVDANINASAAIADTKLDTISTAGKVSNSATTATDANTSSAIVARDASGDFSAGTITADLTGNADTATKLNSTRTFEVTGDVTGTVSSDLTSGASIATSIASGVIVDADVNASAAIAGTKIDPDFGSQTIETTGVINAGSGTEAAPAITVGTTDNGLYSPGTDEVAISTNGTGRLFINSSGSVGIGAASFDERLHISASNPAIKLQDTDGTSQYSVIKNADGNSIYDAVNGVGVGGDHVFRSPEGSANEHLRITSDGKLGLGTSIPGSFNSDGNNLVVGTGSGGQGMSIYSGTSNYGTIYFADGTSGDALYRGSILYNHSSDFMRFDTAAGERMRIDSSGNVGIGTTSPAVALHVDGDIRCDGVYGETDTNTSIQFPGSDVITFNEGGSEAARIDSSGRLLVGTSSDSGGADIQAANSLSVGGLIKREFSKELELSDNVQATYLTFSIPGGTEYSHFANVGAEISYVITANRLTSGRVSRSTYGKVYVAIDRHYENSADNPVAVNLVDTDKALCSSAGTPTITWAASVEAGIDNAAKEVYIKVAVNNPSSNSTRTAITGTVTYHTRVTGSDAVTVS